MIFHTFECVYMVGYHCRIRIEKSSTKIKSFRAPKTEFCIRCQPLVEWPPVVLCAKVPGYSIPLVAHKRLTPHVPNRTRSAAMMCELNRIQNRSRPRVGSEPCEDFLNSREIRVSVWFYPIHVRWDWRRSFSPARANCCATIFCTFCPKEHVLFIFSLSSLCFCPFEFYGWFFDRHTRAFWFTSDYQNTILLHFSTRTNLPFSWIIASRCLQNMTLVCCLLQSFDDETRQIKARTNEIMSRIRSPVPRSYHTDMLIPR